MQLSNLATAGGRPTLVRAARVLPDEPALPRFHKLTRQNLEHIATDYLAQQEVSVFKAYVSMVVNRSASDPAVLEELRGSFAREIRGLVNLREEFEGPISSEDEPPPVDEDIPAGNGT